jgi:peptidoglycan/LPS O-acetylase OafA/YrhL
MLSSLLLLAGALAVHAVPQIAGNAIAAELLLLLTLPFAVLSIGSTSVSGRFGRLLSRADVSCGLYLYGFPIQQSISAAFERRPGPIADFCLTLPLTLICALISWHAVEKVALRLKPPRRSAGGGNR